MNNTLALIRLELKARYGLLGGLSSRSTLLKSILGILFFGGIYALYLFVAYTVVNMFHVYEMDYHFMLTFVLLFVVVLTAIGIGSTIRNLYRSGDNELLLRFPVTGRSMYVAKMVTQVVQQLGIIIACYMPVLIMFGVITGAAPLFWGMLIPSMAVVAIIPLALANLLAIPVMALTAKISHLHLLNLIVSVVLVAGGFALYMVLFENIIGFLRDQSASVFSQNGLQWLIYLRHVYPLSFIADMLMGKRLVLALPILAVDCAALIVGSLALTRRYYLTTVLYNIEAEGASFCHPTTTRCRSVVHSILRREFLQIFRSNNYSFQYLAMAIAAPIMVYSCNHLAKMVASQSLAVAATPALTLLVLFIFITITVSFAGSCVSREGNTFYLTKISPVPAHYQVLVKVLLYLIVAASSVIVSMVVVMATRQMYVSYCFGIMGIGVIYAIGLTCFAVKLDMKHPQFAVGGDGELSNGNFATFVTLGVGLAISVVLGLLGLVGSALWNTPFTFGLICVGVFVLSALAAWWMLWHVERHYNNIVER